MASSEVMSVPVHHCNGQVEACSAPGRLRLTFWNSAPDGTSAPSLGVDLDPKTALQVYQLVRQHLDSFMGRPSGDNPVVALVPRPCVGLSRGDDG